MLDCKLTNTFMDLNVKLIPTQMGLYEIEGDIHDL